MWAVYALLTFACWGIADLFYKKGNCQDGEYNHLKTGIFVGLVMGIHASIYLLGNSTEISLIDMLKYLPVSLLYIASMVIGYKGLKYLELSISSPVQNTSGVITAILLLIFFKEKYDIPFYIATLLIFIGIFWLSIIEVKRNRTERENFRKNNRVGKIIIFTMIFPLIYCLLDGAGTFLDAIYLDKREIISEDVALVCYEYTFLIYAVINFVYLKIKHIKFKIISERPKIIAAIFETVGQIFYVFAMGINSTISAPIVGSYCILSMLLSRIFLKEKLAKKEYIAIFLVIIGIVILAIMDI